LSGSRWRSWADPRQASRADLGQLVVDADVATEVHPITPKPADLAHPQTDGEQVDHKPVAIWDCLPERVHLLVGQDLLSGHRPDGILSADLGCGCDVRGSEALGHRAGEDAP